jgi:hypothetical protein
VRGGDFGQGHYPIGDLRLHALSFQTHSTGPFLELAALLPP